MGTEKRERQKANREAKLAAEAAAEARQKRIRGLITVAVIVVLVIVAGIALSSCSSDSDGAAKTDSDDAAATSTTAASDVTGTSSPKAEYGTGACAPAEGTDKPVLTFDDAPKQCIDPSKTYTATFQTSEGDVTVELDTKRTPVTTNNFVNLARSRYFDGTKIFRTVESAGIIQGGSPHTQDNTDPGPGYTIPDEAIPFTSDDYAPGSLSMARTPAPNSGSAQFFFLANENGRYLGDPSQPGGGTYVVFGQTSEGLDVLEKIVGLDPGDGSDAPSTPVTIEKVTITES